MSPVYSIGTEPIGYVVAIPSLRSVPMQSFHYGTNVMWSNILHLRANSLLPGILGRMTLLS